MSVPYHEILKTPYNIKPVRQIRIKNRLIEKQDLERLEQISNYSDIETLVKNQEKKYIKRI